VCKKGKERLHLLEERKERKDKEIILMQKIKESRVVGMIRARGRLGCFRIASCFVIQPGWMEWSKNWGLIDAKVMAYNKQSVSEIGTLK